MQFDYTLIHISAWTWHQENSDRNSRKYWLLASAGFLVAVKVRDNFKSVLDVLNGKLRLHGSKTLPFNTKELAIWYNIKILHVNFKVTWYLLYY